MTNDEQTQYDEVLRNSNDEQTVLDNNTPDDTSEKKKKGVRFAAGMAASAVAGVGATILSGSTTKETAAEQQAEAIDQPTTNEEVPAWSDGEVAVATGNYDNMSFSEAFAAARAEVGPGGAFEWHGKIYGTYLRDEWQNMSAEERAEYESHFNWSNHTSTSEQPDNLVQNEYSTSEIADNIIDEGEGSEEIVAEVQETNDGITTAQEDEVPVVEVIGVAHNDEMDANVAFVTVDDNEVLLVDVDNDQNFDVMTVDVDGDGEISEQEVFDIHESNITVADLGGFTENEQMVCDETDMPVDIM